MAPPWRMLWEAMGEQGAGAGEGRGRVGGEVGLGEDEVLVKSKVRENPRSQPSEASLACLTLSVKSTLEFKLP